MQKFLFSLLAVFPLLSLGGCRALGYETPILSPLASLFWPWGLIALGIGFVVYLFIDKR